MPCPVRAKARALTTRLPGDAGEDDSVRALLARAYTRWRQPLQRLLGRRMPRREDAEDAVQDVFARYAAAGKALPVEQQEAYLRVVTRNVANDAWQKSSRRESVEAVSLDEHAQLAEQVAADEGADPARRLAQRQRLARLEEALAEMPERRREAFVLHSIDGLTQTEVAQTMGISRRMVHNHVTLALAYCQLRVQYHSPEEMKIAQALMAQSALPDGGASSEAAGPP
jgi:RNA polymerase sigma-70 factor (ECF subfamily)